MPTNARDSEIWRKPKGKSFFSVALAMWAFFPFRAEAVLDAGIAVKFDTAPAYAGCPLIGAGSSLAQPDFCQNLQTPEVYCGTFSASPPLEKDSVVQKGAKACKVFYQAAIQSQQLICDYLKDATFLQNSLSQEAQKVDSAQSADQSAGKGAHCAQKIYGYYRDAALAQNEKLKGAFSALDGPLRGLTKEGVANLKAEIHCQKNGAGDSPPSILLLGLSAQSLSDAKQTLDDLSATATKFSALLISQFASAGAQADTISRRQNALGLVQPSGISSSSPASDHVGSAPTSIVRPVAVSASLSITPLVLIGLQGGAEAAQKAFLPLIGYKAMKSLATEYLAHGSISKVGLLVTMGSLGISLTGTALGAPFFVMVPIGIGYRVVAESLRAAYNAYDNEVALTYRKFWQANLKALVSSTSGNAGQAYASQKKTMAYCSQCGTVDWAANCPGTVGHAHGYNDQYINNTPGYINPWVKKVWDEKNPGYHLLLTIPTVSPTSISP